MSDEFTKGDYIEVMKGTITLSLGTALDTRSHTGYAHFAVLDQATGETREFSLNEVDVVTLFRADVARRLQPPAPVPADVKEAIRLLANWRP